jgi:general secretion pathway protein E
MNKLLEYNIDYSLCLEIDTSVLQQYHIVPLETKELSISIAISSKEQDKEKIKSLFGKPIKFIYCSDSEINSELQYLEFKRQLYKYAILALNNMDKANNNSYIIIFMEQLFSFCILHNVSDIHFEAVNTSVVIRLRIDGELNQIFRFNIELFPLISSIIKYFGNLDISQKRIPLNGRFSKDISNNTYDMRISTIPTIYGESIVIRILDNGNIKKDINTIGFEQNTLSIITKTLRLTQGLVLVTGPTGSGKTTSLYSMIHSLNTKNKKIITIEDPVEYKLDGVMQVNINNEIDLDYQTVLKNILRQDPDILLIGEIRDIESLQIAIQASLTGHLVIATLHTNSAVETITRLLDLKAESYLIASTLKMVLSQRLLRVLCEECKIKDMKMNNYNASGCKSCNYKGYKNRQVVSEVLEIDETISTMISKKKEMHKIQNYINKIGFISLKENAMHLVDNGITTLEEYYSKL